MKVSIDSKSRFIIVSSLTSGRERICLRKLHTFAIFFGSIEGSFAFVSGRVFFTQLASLTFPAELENNQVQMGGQNLMPC
ncbi:hypothetical protein CsSME_00036065 [Camellia sinensis var. sinensis]